MRKGSNFVDIRFFFCVKYDLIGNGKLKLGYMDFAGMKEFRNIYDITW